MNINELVMYGIVLMLIVGGLDYALGGPLKLGSQFEAGLMAMGALALSMVGIITLAPILAIILEPVIVPIYTMLNADPAMFATTILANDMGGFPLAMEMSLTPEAGLFAGTILGAMMGPTIVFTIPVALGIIDKSDQPYLAKGILSGMITIPLGTFVGGVVAGFDLTMILTNLIPIVLVSVLIMLGLWFIPNQMIKGFTIFGKGVVVVAIFGLIVGALELLVGITLIPGTTPVTEGLEIVGEIALTLSGAFVLVELITRVAKKPLLSLGKILGINEIAAAGLVATLANSIPMFQMLKKMDERGKIINIAFAVSAAFVLGDHLGFTAGVAREMIVPMIAGKLVGGITAVWVAILITRKIDRKV
ncbi:ethanolamine utilization protein EutH [Vagococcus salmoninarum]|uniref:ethanolamine utilization protein EutH n=1 Tax=Vagococcus salmoninarum TaxID=2739 RepID=UPI003F9597DE